MRPLPFALTASLNVSRIRARTTLPAPRGQAVAVHHEPGTNGATGICLYQKPILGVCLMLAEPSNHEFEPVSLK